MAKEQIIHVAVRSLVETTMREGSIQEGTLMSPMRAVLGTLAHKKVQKEAEGNYEKEVPLSYTCSYNNIDFLVEGRADGVVQDLMGITIDEIKSTMTPLHKIDETYNPLHWAQAKCYGHFYCQIHQLECIHIRLTYYHLGTEKTKYLVQTCTKDELEAFFDTLMEQYSSRIAWQLRWREARNKALNNYTFPYPTYRKGQRELAVGVYKTIQSSKHLFANAPTGTGKTISTLFPALKAMGKGTVEKLFYLTAKTITRTVAEEALHKMVESGAKIKSLTLTAKDKSCFLEERKCTKEACKYADGHFDRVDEAIKVLIDQHDIITREVIEHYAKTYRVCPFELSLDVAMEVDVVIGDYNYVFDPSASLKRFEGGESYVVLVDESHNLVERAREMYSASLSIKQTRLAKKAVSRKDKEVSRTLKEIEMYLKKIKETNEALGEPYISKEKPKELKKLLKSFLEAADGMLQIGGDLPSDFTEFYFEAYDFSKMYELFDEKYIEYGVQQGSNLVLKLFCMDPSKLIREKVEQYKSVIFFSATLLPMDYYYYMLGGKEDYVMIFDSPFDKKNCLRLIANDVSTRYKDREKSIKGITDYIQQCVAGKSGNYMVFFPSYHYMMQTYQDFKDKVTNLKCQLIVQQPEMDEKAKEAFLNSFKEERKDTTIGFCVLGGMFSEGIDLVGEQLIGVVIIGVGLPQLSLERDLIKHYFNDRQMPGYHYAYTYPGMNKVLQAIGRVIRSETDQGIVLLVDDRFTTPLYQHLLPDHLLPYRQTETSLLTHQVEGFWGKY